MLFCIRVPSLITPVHCITITEEPEISAALNLEFSDAGLNYVSSYGGGSSFEKQIAERCDLLNACLYNYLLLL